MMTGSQALAKELASRTLELCRIPSPIGEERRIADWIEAWAHKLFPAGQVFRLSNSLVVGDLAAGRPTVALIGHLDTIPAHPSDSAPRIEGERILGRGSSDMKGGLAVMMALAEALHRDELPYNLLLIFYEREEGPYQESGLGPLFDRLSAPHPPPPPLPLHPTHA